MSKSTRKPPAEVSANEFWDLLRKHDWHYQYSDDYSVWRAGSDERDYLRRVAMQSDTHTDFFRRWLYWREKGHPGNPPLPEGGESDG